MAQSTHNSKHYASRASYFNLSMNPILLYQLWNIYKHSANLCKAYPCSLVINRYYIYISLMSRVFANGRGDRSSIPGRVISKTQKMVLDAALHNIQHYKIRIKVKVEQSRERSSALPIYLGVVEKGTFASPSNKVVNFFTICIYIVIIKS